MYSFVVITDTPQRLANFLVSRNIIQQNPDGSYTGVRPGMEWVEVPNPIQTAPDVYDTRHVYLVKFAHESEDEKEDDFRNWVLANSSVVTAPANYLLNGEPAGDARKITGENVWLAHDRPERFGVWQ